MEIVRRFSITLPDEIDDILAEWAKQRGQPKADLASFLIERGVEDARDRRYIKTLPPCDAESSAPSRKEDAH